MSTRWPKKTIRNGKRHRWLPMPGWMSPTPERERVVPCPHGASSRSSRRLSRISILRNPTTTPRRPGFTSRRADAISTFTKAACNSFAGWSPESCRNSRSLRRKRRRFPTLRLSVGAESSWAWLARFAAGARYWHDCSSSACSLRAILSGIFTLRSGATRRNGKPCSLGLLMSYPRPQK